MDAAKRCNACKEYKPTIEFSTRIVKGRRYFRTSCLKCESFKRTQRLRQNGQTIARKEAWKRYEAKRKIRRQSKSPIEIAHWICEDSKKSARKRGLEFDLEEAIIAKFIVNGCVYCGEKNLRITLDRIDNAKGYKMDNIKPACIRCNYARGNMPYSAWKYLITGMRKARLAGAFGDWQSKSLAAK